MAVAYKSGGAGYTPGTNQPNVNVPNAAISGLATGDVLCIFVVTSQDDTGVTGFNIAAVSGNDTGAWAYTFFARSGTAPAMACFVKVRQSGNTATQWNITKTGGISASFLAHIVVHTGGDPTTPIAAGPAVATEGAENQTAITAPSLTIPTGLPDQAMWITWHTSAWYIAGGSGGTGRWTVTGERVDIGSDWNQGVTASVLVGSGATGTKDATAAASQGGNLGRGISVAIRPAATDQTIDLDNITITVSIAGAVDPAELIDLDVPNITITLYDLDVSKEADPFDPVALTYTVYELDNAKGIDLDAEIGTSITVNSLTVESGRKEIDLAVVDTVATLYPVSSEIVDNRIYIDLTTISTTIALDPVEGDRGVDVADALNVTVSPQEVVTEKYADLDNVYTQVDLYSISILQTSMGVAVVPTTVTLQAVDVDSAADLDEITTSITLYPLEGEKYIDLDAPIAIGVTAEDVTFSGPKILGLIQLEVITNDIELDKAVDLDTPGVSVSPQAVTYARSDEVQTIDTAVSLWPVELPTVDNVDTIIATTTLLALDNAKAIDLDVVTVSVATPDLHVEKVHDLTSEIGTTVNVETAVAFIPFRQVEINITLHGIEVGFGVDDTAKKQMARIEIVKQPTRVIAQDILTGRFLHWDLEVNNLTLTKTLSGPQIIRGEFSNEIRDLRDAGLDAWATWIHVEEDGKIRGSGILQPRTVDQGEALSLDAVGVSAYPSGIPYLDELIDINLDPADIVRNMWAHIQSYPNGDLGVVVRGTTPVRIGQAPVDPPLEGEDTRTEEEKARKPYSLVWWEAKDIAQEIASLAKETPFDYVEREEWNADKTDVLHYIDLGYPRIGTYRHDLRFAQEENLVTAIGPGETDDFYASQVVVIGSGEGRETVRGYAGKPMGGRLRRVVVFDDKSVDNTIRANALSADELLRRQALQDVTEVEVDARHLNARLGSFDVGDDIPVIADVPWIGSVRQWERVLSFTYSPDAETVRINLRRSESFNYGSGATTT